MHPIIQQALTVLEESEAFRKDQQKRQQKKRWQAFLRNAPWVIVVVCAFGLAGFYI